MELWELACKIQRCTASTAYGTDNLPHTFLFLVRVHCVMDEILKPLQDLDGRSFKIIRGHNRCDSRSLHCCLIYCLKGLLSRSKNRGFSR